MHHGPLSLLLLQDYCAKLPYTYVCADPDFEATSEVQELIKDGQKFVFKFPALPWAKDYGSGDLVTIRVLYRGDVGESYEYYLVTAEDKHFLGLVGEDINWPGSHCTEDYFSEDFSVSVNTFNSFLGDDHLLTIEADATLYVGPWCSPNDVYIQLFYKARQCP